VLCVVITGLADPEALQDGASETDELHETPGPDTLQDASAPLIPEALHDTATVVPLRTRLGVAVIVRSAEPPVHQFAATVTFGQ